MEKKKIIVGATGASGLPILISCLQIIQEASEYESCLIMSDSARITLAHETEYSVEEVEAYADCVFSP